MNTASLPEIRNLLSEAFSNGECLLLVLSKPRAASAAPFTRVTIRPVSLNRGDALQFTYHHPRKETHENVSPQAAAALAATLLQDVFSHAHLFTPTADQTFREQAAGLFKRKRSPPSKTAAEKTHNRSKQYLLPEGEPIPFLIEIGIMNSAGTVLAPKYHKFRQINRFLELADDVLSSLPTDRTLRVLDFGSGKSYLTFALHHLLTVIRKTAVQITGIDQNAEIIADCTRIAERLQCRGLEFRAGDIRSFPVTEQVDLVVSLHACDTATDDVLASAIQAACPVILAVPCCQHELATKIHAVDLDPLERHGILKERFAALATDALRVEVLELSGYQTQIVEFIDLEHTPKNLLIRAIRRDTAPVPKPERVESYERFKRALGIESPYLEGILDRRNWSPATPP